MKPLACLCMLACLAGLASPSPAAEPHPALRLTANIWEPYTGADLPRQGIASEIVTTALARAGYTAEISIMPWSRALDYLVARQTGPAPRRGYPNADGIIAAFNVQLAAMKKDGTLEAITRRLAHPAK